MPGPAPLPTALKILNGNPGHRPLNLLEPKPAGDAPDCPDHLGDSARDEWYRVVPELLQLGLLTKIDQTALAAYCVAYGRWVEAEAHIREHGLTVLTPNGYPQKSPWLSIADKCLDQMLKFLIQFGMTPSSRSKVSVTPTADGEDDKFFK